MKIETDVDMQALLEDIFFSYCLGGDILMNPERCIPIRRMWRIMGTHIPEINEFFKNNTVDEYGEITENKR
jgi:hypothetical protein